MAQGYSQDAGSLIGIASTCHGSLAQGLVVSGGTIACGSASACGCIVQGYADSTSRITVGTTSYGNFVQGFATAGGIIQSGTSAVGTVGSIVSGNVAGTGIVQALAGASLVVGLAASGEIMQVGVSCDGSIAAGRDSRSNALYGVAFGFGANAYLNSSLAQGGFGQIGGQNLRVNLTSAPSGIFQPLTLTTDGNAVVEFKITGPTRYFFGCFRITRIGGVFSFGSMTIAFGGITPPTIDATTGLLTGAPAGVYVGNFDMTMIRS